MTDFKSSRVLITGGSRGIGLAAAEAYSNQGARVAISGQSQQSVDNALTQLPRGIVGIVADVASVSDCERLVSVATEQLRGLDILVNSAGVFERADIVDTDEAIWDRVLDVNLKGSYFCSRAAIPALRESRGNIVHLGSESGINGYAGTSAYCASKGALVNLTRVMAVELAPEIRVNCVCPGVVETDMARQAFAIDGDQDAGMAHQRDSYPMKTIGSVKDIAAAILYLSGRNAGFITGESLVIDGGATVGR